MAPLRMLILFIMITVHLSHAILTHHREQQFAKILHYELININTELFESANIIKFNAFGTQYEVQLVPNHDMIPSHIRHANINPATISSAHDPYFTSLSQTCHFFGHVLNTAEPSSISLSLCSKRGIRGRVLAFNDTLIIQPSAYYLDREKDKYGYHDITDQHLVYKLSDFNSSFVSEDDSESHFHQPQAKARSESHSDHKRRMLQNNGVHKVEVLIINDAFRTHQYIKDYEHQWYEQLVADYVDVINMVSNEYYTTDWGVDVGEIRVYLVELEIIFEYTSRHELLSPPLYDPECLWSEFYCPINSNKWLSTLAKWLGINKPTNAYDYAHLVTNGRFEPDRTGLGLNGKMCKGAASIGIGMQFEGLHRLARTIAHELGHDFGMYHDGGHPASYGYECPAYGTNAGIMGGELHGWSNCSVKDLHDWVTTNDVSCLGTDVDTFTSNHVPNASTTAPPVTTQKHVVLRAPLDRAICIGITGFDIFNKSHLDGEWWNVGMHNNRSIYSKESFILYYNRSMWIITRSFSSSDTDILGYCVQPKIEQCHNNFNIHIPVQNVVYKIPNHTQIYDCYPSMQDSDEDDAWGCIRFWGFDIAIYDGYWSEIGYNEGQPMYAKDGYYLYYQEHNSINASVWLISTIMDNDYADSETVASCFETDVTQCGFGHFRVLNTYNAWVVRKHSMIARCDYNPRVNNTCIFHDCVAIYGLHIGRNGRIYNGIWRPAGCHNGQAYYLSNGDRSMYLYYSSIHWVWMISDMLGSEIAEAYCPKGEVWGKNGSIDIMDTNSGWYVMSDTGWEFLISDVVFTPCAAFSEERNIVCLQPDGYEDSLCVNGDHNDTQWQYTFQVYTKLCSNKKPIYYSIVTNDSDTIEGKDVFGNIEIRRTYYLYYMMDFIYPDSSEMEGKWIISEDKLSKRGAAFCLEEHVFECTQHSWRVWDVLHDDYIADESMTVSNGECGSMSSLKTNVVEVFIWIAALCIVVFVIAICAYCVCRKMNGNNANTTVDSMGLYVNQESNVENQPHEKVGIEVIQYPAATNQQFTSYSSD